MGLSTLRLLRLRERVGRGSDGGWAPTDQDVWRFHSHTELHSAIDSMRHAGRLFTEFVDSPPLLLGLTLRRDISQPVTDTNVAADAPVSETLWTAPVGLEWVEGPAADPLQLGLRLGLGPGSRAEIDLEFVSGGWSEWAVT